MSAMGGNPLTRGQPFPWHTANQPPCPDWGKSPADWPRPTFRDDQSHVASHGQVRVCITTGVGPHGQRGQIRISPYGSSDLCLCLFLSHLRSMSAANAVLAPDFLHACAFLLLMRCSPPGQGVGVPAGVELRPLLLQNPCHFGTSLRFSLVVF